MACVHLQRHSRPDRSPRRRHPLLPAAQARQSCRSDDQRKAEMEWRTASATFCIFLDGAHIVPVDRRWHLVADRAVRPGLRLLQAD